MDSPISVGECRIIRECDARFSSWLVVRNITLIKYTVPRIALIKYTVPRIAAPEPGSICNKEL